MGKSRYEEAGVSIEAQDQAISAIRGHVAKTKTPRVLADIGSFGGLFDIRFEDMKHPVLVSSTDGIGTKLKIAFESGRHNTVGQCLVNHCVDDILVQGARPLFFMDYIATGKLRPQVVASIIEGMAVACAENGCAILGGEMAEMPGFYQAGEYDVAGFIVGVVEKEKILDANRVRPGQKLLGLQSSGLHTNGYSLARKILFEEQALKLKDYLPGTNTTVEEALLAVHRSYYPILKDLLKKDLLQAMSHITGGGFLDNIPRVLPADADAVLNLGAYPLPPLFEYLKAKGGLDEEAYQVFNMGIGMVLIAEEANVEAIKRHLQSLGEPVWELGHIAQGTGKVVLT